MSEHIDRHRTTNSSTAHLPPPAQAGTRPASSARCYCSAVQQFTGGLDWRPRPTPNTQAAIVLGSIRLHAGGR